MAKVFKTVTTRLTQTHRQDHDTTLINEKLSKQEMAELRGNPRPLGHRIIDFIALLIAIAIIAGIIWAVLMVMP